MRLEFFRDGSTHAKATEFISTTDGELAIICDVYNIQKDNLDLVVVLMNLCCKYIKEKELCKK